MLPVCGRLARGVNGGTTTRLRVRGGLCVDVSQPESASPKRKPRIQDQGYKGPVGEMRERNELGGWLSSHIT